MSVRNLFFCFCIGIQFFSFGQLPVDDYYKVNKEFETLKETHVNFSDFSTNELHDFHQRAKQHLNSISKKDRYKTASTYQYLINLNLELKRQDTVMRYLYKYLQIPGVVNSKGAVHVHWNIFKLYEYSENYMGMLEELKILNEFKENYGYHPINTDKIKAGVLITAGLYSEAKDAYILLLKDSLTIDPLRYSVVLNDLASVYTKLGIKDSAEFYRNKALNTLRRKKSERYDLDYVNYIKNYIQLQHFFYTKNYSQEGYDLAKKFLNIALKNHAQEYHTSVFAYHYLANYYFIKNNYKEAMDAINNAIALGNERLDLNNLQDLYFLKSRIHDALGEKTQAIKNIEKFNVKRDLIASKKRNFDMVKYEVNQIKTKKLEAEKLALENETKFNYTLYILLLVVVILSIIILFFKSTVTKNKKIKKAQNVIKEKLEEKEFLLKELNHRVKNNLALILSLIEFQADDLEDDTYKEKFKNLEKRINTIAIAHEQFIYDEEHIKGKAYNLKEYINKIVLGLQNIAVNNPDINITINNDVKVNVDTALPIGIILNELISNSIEHALPKGKLIIDIYLNQFENTIKIEYKDNGLLFKSFKKPTSLGMSLIESMVQQLSGQLKRTNSNYYISLNLKK